MVFNGFFGTSFAGLDVGHFLMMIKSACISMFNLKFIKITNLFDSWNSAEILHNISVYFKAGTDSWYFFMVMCRP